MVRSSSLISSEKVVCRMASNTRGHHRIIQPATGQCERIVQELRKALHTRSKQVSLSVHLSRFLFNYCNTPHTTTCQLPASLLFKKQPTSRLSLLQPGFASVMQLQHPVDDMSPSKEFVSSDYVWVSNAHPDSKWLEGTVVKHLIPLTYVVSVSSTNRHVHIEHLRRRPSQSEEPSLQPPQSWKPTPAISS